MPAERALAAALLALLGVALALARRRPALARAGATLAIVAIAVALVARWLRTGHPPVFGTYEMNLAETALLLATALPLDRALGRYLAAPLLVSLATVAHTFAFDPAPAPLTISEQSLWIDLHAPLAWLAWCAYWHALLLAWRPDAEQLAFRALGHAFAAHAALGAVGVYYASVLFADPWSWDPVQTLGLLAWILAALAIHLKLFFGLSPRRQRAFLALVVACYVVSAKALAHLPAGQSFHVFEVGELAAEPK